MPAISLQVLGGIPWYPRALPWLERCVVSRTASLHHQSTTVAGAHPPLLFLEYQLARPRISDSDTILFLGFPCACRLARPRALQRSGDPRRVVGLAACVWRGLVVCPCTPCHVLCPTFLSSFNHCGSVVTVSPAGRPPLIVEGNEVYLHWRTDLSGVDWGWKVSRHAPPAHSTHSNRDNSAPCTRP